MCLTLTAFDPEICGDNPGGLAQVWAIAKKDILSFPNDFKQTGTTAIAIVPKAGKVFTPIGFLNDNAGYDAKMMGEPGNNSIEQMVKVTIPNYTPKHIAFFMSLMGNGVVLVAEDLKGQSVNGLIVFGTLIRPLYADIDHKGGTKFSDKRESTLTFKGGMSNYPFFYTAALPV
jgi:hypothetical protein